MTSANNVMEMYRSITSFSPTVDVEELFHAKEGHNQGGLVYEGFGECLVVYAKIVDLSSISPEEIFKALQDKTFRVLASKKFFPYLENKENYTKDSAAQDVAWLWGVLGKNVSTIFVGGLVRLMIAEALSEVNGNFALQYNYTKMLLLGGEDGVIRAPDIFSIMANKDTYIQMMSFLDKGENYCIYGRSKVNGVEMFSKNIVFSGIDEKTVRDAVLKAVSGHFQHFVEKVVELNDS